MTGTQARSPRSPALTLLMLGSGFCGISYEILYGRVLGNLAGDQFAVNAAVLLTFLLGIGFGSLYAHRWWRHLWLIEAAIGGCGAAFALGTRPLDAALYAAGAASGGGLPGAVLACSLLLSAPSFLIGCSLPLFAGYLSRVSSESAFARAYAAYNLGAAATAVLIEYWLLRRLGLRLTLLVVAGSNLAVAAALLTAFRGLREAQPPTTTEQARFPRRQLAALAAFSVGSAVFQLLMIKLAECVLGPFRETFALVLAVVFLGIALGSAAAGRWRIGFASLLLGNLAGIAWVVVGFRPLAGLYAALHPYAILTYPSSVLLKLAAIAAVMGPAAITFGAAIPALLQDQPHVARESGRLLFVSSAANALGFLLMAFFLHQTFDYGTLLLLVAASTGLSLAATLRFHRGAVAAAAAALLVLAGLRRLAFDEDLLYVGHATFHSAEDLSETRAKLRTCDRFKGRQDTFSINWVDGAPFFFINGFISFQLDLPYERLVGAYGSLVAPRTDKALVLGLGSGATAGAAALLFDRLDAVEINPVVLANLHRMKAWNFDIESRRPRVNIVLDDAVHFLKASRERYSLIINTVTSPLYFSSSKLYTLDFLRVVRDRLAPDGVYVTWVDGRVGDAGMNIILKTLSRSFGHAWLASVRSGYFLLICSAEPIAIRRPRLIADQPVLADFFYRQGRIRPEWIPYGLTTTLPFDLVQDIPAPVNTLNLPALEFEMTRLRRRGFDDFKRRLASQLDLAEIRAALEPAMRFDAADFAVYNDFLYGPSLVSRRWQALAAGEEPSFQARFDATKARLYVEHARAAGTAGAHHKAGMVLLEAGRRLDALKEFLAALQLDPLRDDVWFNVGSCNERLGRLERALDGYLREQQVDPGDKDVPLRLGRVYYKLRRYPEALAALDRALAVNPEDEARRYRRKTLRALGR